MDTDISHAVEERLAAIELRLDALDGGSPAEPKEEDESQEEEEPALPVAASRSRSRRRPSELVMQEVQPTVIEPSSIEGVEL